MINYTVSFHVGVQSASVNFLGTKKWTVRKIEESARICLLSHGYSVEECLSAVVCSISFKASSY